MYIWSNFDNVFNNKKYISSYNSMPGNTLYCREDLECGAAGEIEYEHLQNNQKSSG